jgi:hypothetical protein
MSAAATVPLTGLDAKLAAKIAAKPATTDKANTVLMAMTEDHDEDHFGDKDRPTVGGMIYAELPKAQLLDAIKPSKAKTTEGCMLSLNDTFTFPVNGNEVKFRIKGSGWFTVDVVL